MDTQKIAILLQIAELGSYSKASEVLGYTPSALSYITKQVETDIGITLLKKDYKGITLTNAGLRIIPLLQKLLATEKEVRQNVMDEKQTIRSWIRLVSFPCLTLNLIPQAIESFNKLYPEIQIQLMTATGNDVANIVKSGAADIGIADFDYFKNLEYLPLRKDHYKIAVPISCLETPGKNCYSLEDFNSLTYLVSDYTPTHLVNTLKSVGFKHFRHIYTYHGQSVLAMVNQQFGVSLMSELYEPVCPDRVKMYALTPPLVREFCALTRSIKELDAATQDFIEILQETCRRCDETT